MPTAREYVDIEAADAVRQWQSIERRTPVTEGRQVDYVPVETVLSLAASLLVDHRRYGGSTSNRAEEPVPTLALLFRRRNSSVLAKMANLDGSRRNGAKYEVEVAGLLLSQPGRLASVYRVILAAARAAGIGVDRLPDFLELEDNQDDLLLLGQEELTSAEVEGEAGAGARRWLDQRSDLEERITERLLVAAARVGQHRFASEVLRNHGHGCVFCGLRVTSAGGRARRMLLASHIKPWKDCNARERLDPLNGLTACPTHDVAFDTGLITVNGGLRIHVTPDLERAAAHDVATRAVFGRPPLQERLLLPDDATPPQGVYLRWHHTNIYQGTLAA